MPPEKLVAKHRVYDSWMRRPLIAGFIGAAIAFFVVNAIDLLRQAPHFQPARSGQPETIQWDPISLFRVDLAIIVGLAFLGGMLFGHLTRRRDKAAPASD